MDTDWKFIPKMPGTASALVPEWSLPSISLTTACTLYPSYCWVAALSVVQSPVNGRGGVAVDLGREQVVDARA